MNSFERLLVGSSGALQNILERPECRADVTRFAMVGAFVLLTSIFALFSATFAVYTGFRSLPLSATLGLLWATLIFTVDRFVVSTIRKSDAEGLARWTRFVRRTGDWLTAIPRLALAIIISIVVATPLEMRFFAPEIDAEIADLRHSQLQHSTAAIDAEFPELQHLREENSRLERETAAARTTYDAAYQRAIEERSGSGITGKVGAGPIWDARMTQANRALEAAQRIARTNDAAIAANTTAIDELTRRRQARLASDHGTIVRSDGFLARYSALGRLAATNGDVRVARGFMTLLFLVVELTPVLMKLMLRRSAYDEILDTIEHTARVEQLQRRSDLNDDVHAALEIHSRKNLEWVLLQESLIREAFDPATVRRVAGAELDDAFRRLAVVSIDAWMRSQLKTTRPPATHHMPIRKPN
jgi:hypothetical protein